jgi:hypothetical protein
MLLKLSGDMNMSIREYIQKELEQMRRDCEKHHMTPEEWISKYAMQYYKLHFKELREASAEKQKPS